MVEDTKAKNAKVIKKQAKVEEKKTEEPVQIDTTQAANKLSKRSEDYLYKLRKELVVAGKTEEEAKTIADGLIPEVYENQIKGVPANKLYGTPAQKVDDLLNTKKQQAQIDQPYWKIAVDSALFFLGIFAAMYGVLGLTGGTKQGQTGIVTLAGMAILMGSLLPWFNLQNRKPREERPRLLKMLGYILIGLVAMMVWLFLTALLPTFLNPVLPGIPYLVMAVAAFAIRYFFRKQNNITTSAIF